MQFSVIVNNCTSLTSLYYSICNWYSKSCCINFSLSWVTYSSNYAFCIFKWFLYSANSSTSLVWPYRIAWYFIFNSLMYLFNSNFSLEYSSLVYSCSRYSLLSNSLSENTLTPSYALITKLGIWLLHYSIIASYCIISLDISSLCAFFKSSSDSYPINDLLTSSIIPILIYSSYLLRLF